MRSPSKAALASVRRVRGASDLDDKPRLGLVRVLTANIITYAAAAHKVIAQRSRLTAFWRVDSQPGNGMALDTMTTVATTNRGAIAGGHPATVDAAAVALEVGGNAVDAALAGMCAACVAEPVLASLGGGGFLMVSMETGAYAGQPIACDFFVDTPRRRRPIGELDFRSVMADFGTTQQEFHIGLGAMATPGVVAGLFETHRRFGRLPMREVVAPAVHLARTGAVVTDMQARIMGIVGAILRADADTASMFASRRRSGALLSAGEVMFRPRFADFLEVLSIEGPDLFYRGEIAARIAADCRAGGGYLTGDDFAGYQVKMVAPLRRRGFETEIFFMPLPSLGGLLVAFSLALLEAADIGKTSFGGSDHLWLLTRGMRLAAEARVTLAVDDRSVADRADRLFAASTLAPYREAMRARIPVARGTTHISVVDGHGNAASLSISNGEGAAYVVPEAGIIMNNMLGEADINPHGFHVWPTGSRLHSMMTPCVAIGSAGDIAVLGSGGSNRIRSAILQVLLNTLGFGMPIGRAVSAPRVHYENGRIDLEPGFGAPAIAALEERAVSVHNWDQPSMFFGGVHAVRREATGHLEAVGDVRRGGAARIL